MYKSSCLRNTVLSFDSILGNTPRVCSHQLSPFDLYENELENITSPRPPSTKEPDLRGEVDRDEVGSLKQQYPLAIQRGERAGVPAEPLPHLGGLTFTACPSAESEDVKSCKALAASLTPCMVNPQSQEGKQLCYMVTMSYFLPEQRQDSGSPTSNLDSAAGLCKGSEGLVAIDLPLWALLSRCFVCCLPYRCLGTKGERGWDTKAAAACCS
ncbi:hypothetical protein LEMLEM_LOCUS370 [Lemmus lemmus]